MMETWTVEQYRERARRQDTRRKYRNRPIVEDGIRFDSQAEYVRWHELKMLEDAGYIQRLRPHPRYVLQDPFMRDGQRIRAIHYEADFEYYEDGRCVVEDVKGGRATQTAAFRLKRKMFLKRYPDVEFRIVSG